MSLEVYEPAGRNCPCYRLSMIEAKRLMSWLLHQNEEFFVRPGPGSEYTITVSPDCQRKVTRWLDENT